jgi:Fe-S cluster assembly protein SufD
MSDASPAARLARADDPGKSPAGGPTDGLLAATTTALSRRPRGGPAWLEARRAEAAAQLERIGFPSSRDESFRFTPLAGLLRVPYLPRPDQHSAPTSVFDRFPGRRIRIENGRLQGALPGAETGVEIRGMAEVLAREPGLLEPHLSRLAAGEHGFVAQNTALFDDGIVIVARARKKSELIHLAYAGGGSRPTLGTPRVLVIAEAESELAIVETHAPGGEYLESSVTEVFLGAGAAFEHVRIELGSKPASTLATVAVRQGRDSRYRSRVFSFGGGLTRVELRVALEEEGGDCSLDGLYLAPAGALVDHHTRIVHASPRCTSRERFKGILDGDGVAVFDGTIVVNRGASGTEAHQENRNLLLSNDAVVHAKPHLEIDTDDVRCSHGATVGRLDPAQLFYLRSRGIDPEVARSLLTYAFAREMVATVTRADLRELLEELVATQLPSGMAARELA